MRSADQRRTIRIPVPEERRYAELRVGRRTIPARLLNESSGGFAVQLDRDSSVTSGQSLILGTASGWCRVRVIYLQRSSDGLYVGMQRLGDLPADWNKWMSVRIWPFHRLRIPLPGLGWSHCVFGGLAVCGAVLVVAFWNVLGFGGTPRWINRTGEIPMLGGRTFASSSGVSSSASSTRTESASSSSGRVQHAEGAPLGRHGWFERQLDQRSKDTSRSLRDVRSSSPKVSLDLPVDLRGLGEQVQDWTEIVNFSTDELPDASLLLSPDVEKQLQITPEQRAEILSIVRASNEAAEAVYGNATDARSSLVRFQVAEVRKAASERAVAILSAWQKMQLKSLRKR
jgi:hypothetical protein